ncbi:unnamed protein product [Chironomus riparius]|uniref:Uncharacterized protein n=1 Tax=Chironomus riparius TaxID=315576 RepID=A0A9N9WKQ5_9DIPT|nr:unnamed protein product [Chironomus riparius]
MKSNFVIFNALITLLSTKGVFCLDVCDDIPRNIKESNQFLLHEWGTINHNSVRIDLTTWYLRTFDEGTIAVWNATIIFSREMHGIRLRSVDNTVSSAEIIHGGIGFRIAIITVIGHANILTFTVDAFETPDIIFKEWGTVNNASLTLFPTWSHVGCSESEQIINTTRIIHGLRLISSIDSVASTEVLDGGVGFNFVHLIIRPRVQFIRYTIIMFENGTSTSTPAPSITSMPETRVEILGRINDDTQLLDEKRFQNYPEAGFTAEGNGSFQGKEIILGIRLTSLNYTDGSWEIIEGGLNQSFIAFEFIGSDIGRPYDFKIEVYGNNAIIMKLSGNLFILLSVLHNILR